VIISFFHIFKMPQCIAHTAVGAQCSRNGSYFGGYCKTHFDKRVANDPAFQQAYRHSIRDIRDEEAAQERGRAFAAAAEEARLAKAAVEREQKIAARETAIGAVPTMGALSIMNYAIRIMRLWEGQDIPDYDIPKAYAVLAYRSPTVAGFQDVLRCVVRIYFMAGGRHPDHAGFQDVPDAEKNAAYAELRAVVAPFGDNLLSEIIDARWSEAIRERRTREAAAAEAARRAQLAIDLRERPVVFERDPEGSVNLRAFAADSQSIHRSSVQNTTQRAILTLLSRPVHNGDAIEEITSAFEHPTLIRWANEESRNIAIHELTNDYFVTVAFGVPYADILNRVWAYISAHTQYDDLCLRLAQEVCEGRGMCSNGKMARLVNVLQGYDETIEAEVPKELFQERIAALSKAPRETRAAAAAALFAEFIIPAEQQGIWMEALMDAE
jgi:hypothetical protein